VTGWTRRAALAGLASLGLVGPTSLAAQRPRSRRARDFHALAPRPPMGWNSWDSFGPTIDEAQARANALAMAEQLLPHGYDIFTVDIQWYEPGATSFTYRAGAELAMDAWGRLLPAPNRFPSAAGGRGFRPLADDIHRLGLKFGVHLMRGVPRLAADRDLPIHGTQFTCGSIADRVNICQWNADMYGVDMTKPGAQAYYDSVFALLASWGVDFVKVDDIARPYRRNQPEIEAVRRAIDRSGRPMLLSLSPGETALEAAAHVSAHANMWRISDDFWDEWRLLVEQFARLANWAPFRRAGAWPDADMLPLGLLALGQRRTRFTPDEQRVMMTLWAIARSPLIMGGDLRALDAATLALLTNDAMIAVNQHSRDNRQLYRTDPHVAWVARDERSRDSYLALFNIGEHADEVRADLSAAGLRGTASVTDLWTGRALGGHRGAFSATLPAHGAGLYRLSPA
jgi:hypothetical protein